MGTKRPHGRLSIGAAPRARVPSSPALPKLTLWVLFPPSLFHKLQTSTFIHIQNRAEAGTRWPALRLCRSGGRTRPPTGGAASGGLAGPVTDVVGAPAEETFRPLAEAPGPGDTRWERREWRSAARPAWPRRGSCAVEPLMKRGSCAQKHILGPFRGYRHLVTAAGPPGEEDRFDHLPIASGVRTCVPPARLALEGIGLRPHPLLGHRSALPQGTPRGGQRSEASDITGPMGGVRKAYGADFAPPSLAR